MNNLGFLLSMTKRSYWQHPKKGLGGKSSTEDQSPIVKVKGSQTTRALKRMQFWKKQKPRSGTIGGDPDA
jgi:hypothetical protein